MSDEPFNSASRLYRVIRQANNYRQDGMLVAQAWMELFEINAESTAERFEAVVDRLRAIRQEALLLESVITATRRLPAHITLPIFTMLFRVADIYVSFNQPWSTVRVHITEAGMQGLAHLIYDLPTDERPIDINELRDIEAQLKELQQQILQSSLSEDIRGLFLRIIELMLQGVQTYRIRGRAAFRDALATLLAALKIDEETFERAKSDVEGANVWASARPIIIRMLMIVSAINDAAQLNDWIRGFLPS